MKLKLLFLLLLMITLFSCEQKDDTDNIFKNVCKSEVYEIPADFQPDTFKEIIVEGENIYVQGYGKTGPAVYKYDMNGQNPVLADIELRGGGVQYAVSDTETIVVDEVFADTYRERILITKYNGDDEIFTVDVDNIFNVSIIDIPISYSGEDYFTIAGVVASNGQYYIAGGKKIAVLDASGKRIALINVSGGEIINLIAHGDDVLFMVRDTRTNVCTVSYVDKINNKVGDKLPLPAELITAGLNSAIFVGDGYDLYIKNNVGLYGYNIGSEPVEVANWLNSDLIGFDLKMLAILSPSEYLYIVSLYNGYAYDYEFGKLTLISEDEYAEKTILRLAQLHSVLDLDRLVVKFNKSSDKYRIVIDNYGIYDEEIRATKLNADIAGGNIPDIFAYRTDWYEGEYPIESYVSQGIFMDLLEMFDRDDEISTDVLHDIVLKSFTTDNKLFMLPQSMTATMFVGKKANFSFNTWTPLEMIAYNESLPEDQILTTSMLFRVWNDGILNHYIDYENKVVEFDDDFKKLLNYRIEHRYDNPGTENLTRDETTQLYRSDKWLLRDANVYSLGVVIECKERFGSNEITFIGHPAMTGNGSTISSGTYYSISANSKNLDGAWEFMKFYLSRDLPEMNAFDALNLGFSVINKHLEQYIEYYVNTTFVQWDNGFMSNYSNPLTAEEKEELENYNGEYELYTLSREEIDEFLNIMATLPPDYTIDETISEIYWEELSVYDKNPTDENYDKMIAVMKNRMELYLNEKY